MRTPWISQIVKWQALRQYNKLIYQLQHPQIAQQQQLDKLVHQGKNTKFGKTIGLSEVKTLQQLQRSIPVQNYESIKGFIHLMMLGEANVLVPGRVKWFAKSSGTTSDKSKYIPVPSQSLYGNHLLGGWQAAGSVYTFNPKISAFDGKQLIMGGSHTAFAEHPTTRFGDVSAVMLQHMPQVLSWAYTPDIATALMANTDAKIEKMANQAAKEDVRSVSGAPTWMTVLFRLVLEKTGKDHLLEVWPNLQVIYHGGMSFAPYQEMFKQMIPAKNVLFLDVYNASEGYFSFQEPAFANAGHLVMLGSGIFIELLPTGEWDSTKPLTIALEEAEIGELYAPVISTNAGLWRYLTGDTIRITQKNPIRWQIVGRMREHINVFGEEVMVTDTDKALQEVCALMHSTIMHYTVGPIFFSDRDCKGGHEWIIEFEEAPKDIEKFTALLDLALQGINSDYEAKRYKDLALKRLKLFSAPKGTFNRWLQSKGRYGFQNKVPRLANDRKLVEEILKFT